MRCTILGNIIKNKNYFIYIVNNFIHSSPSLQLSVHRPDIDFAYNSYRALTKAAYRIDKLVVTPLNSIKPFPNLQKPQHTPH